MDEDIKVTEVAWEPRGAGAPLSLQRCCACCFAGHPGSRAVVWGCRLPGCPQITQGVTESAQPASRHPSSSVVGIGRGPKA